MGESTWSWSKTAASNATADSSVNYAEGQSPGSLNNSGRSVMAAHAKARDDQGGALTLAGGTTAYTLTTNQGLATLADGVRIHAVVNATNTGASTLAVDGLAAKAIRKNADEALVAGDLVANTHVMLQYDASANGAAGAWLIPSHVPRVVVQVFTSDGTYTPTAGMKYCIVEAVGGGAGGGGVANSGAGNQSGGGGGGGGGYARKLLTAADIGASKAVDIGAKGTGGAAGANNGTDGADTTLGTTLVVAKGGTKGLGGASGVRGAGGAGGVAGTGDVTVPGQAGGEGSSAIILTVTLRGGDGGDAACGFGAGGRAYYTAATGAAGTNYGAGGSGGHSQGAGGAAAGGDGTAGVMIITEYL